MDKEETPAVVKEKEEKEEMAAPTEVSTIDKAAMTTAEPVKADPVEAPAATDPVAGDAEEAAAIEAAIKASIAAATTNVDGHLSMTKVDANTEGRTDELEVATDEAALSVDDEPAAEAPTDEAEVATDEATLSVQDDEPAAAVEVVVPAKAAEELAEVAMVPVTVEVERAPSLFDMLGAWVSGRLSATAGKCIGQEPKASEEAPVRSEAAAAAEAPVEAASKV